MFIARHNRKRTITFNTDRSFSTIKDSESFIIQHYEAVGDQDDLVLTLGLASEGTVDATFADAVLESVTPDSPIGDSIITRYSFKVSAFSGLASTPPDDEFENGSFPIPNGVNNVIVTGLALSQSPAQVFQTIRKPTGGLTLAASVDSSTITTDGWTSWFTGKTDNANYFLDYLVVF